LSFRGEPLARSFAEVDKRVKGTLGDLHDYLWMGQRTDVGDLRHALSVIGGEVEAFLGKKSAFAKPVRHLAAALSRETEGSGTLYSLISNFWHLAAATEHRAGKRYASAAARCFEVVDGPMIGFASAVGHHDWVDEKDAGTLTYETYMRRVADAMEAKGARSIGQLKRLAMLVEETRQGVSTKSVPSASLAVDAALQASALYLALYPQVLRELGWYRDVPHRDYPRLAEFIASRR
jgi:hypothetical protein